MLVQASRPTQVVELSNEAATRSARKAGSVSSSEQMGIQIFLLVIEALHQSAEACPPLRSAVGAIMAIVILCEVRARNLLSYHIIVTPMQ